MRIKYQPVMAIFTGLLITAFFSISIHAAKKLKFRWDFSGKTLLAYSVEQKLQVQNELYDFESQTWLKTPIHQETVEGVCGLRPLGDGNALATVMLQLKNITEKNTPKPMQREQYLPQVVARFVLQPDGTFQQYMGGSSKETYTLLRLLFGLPATEFSENEGRVFPFTLFTRDDELSLSLKGSISHELRGFETLNDRNCAKIHTQIDLKEAGENARNGSLAWKGIGDSYFAMEEGRPLEMVWQVAKKLETTSDGTPRKIVEIYDIRVTYNPDLKELPDPGIPGGPVK